MFRESLSTFSIPLFIYIVMGVVITRIQLNNVNPKNFGWLQWLQFAVDVLRIVFLWPLVLFTDKLHGWLVSSSGVEDRKSGNEMVAVQSHESSASI
mgnify:CR=1 FL=1